MHKQTAGCLSGYNFTFRDFQESVEQVSTWLGNSLDNNIINFGGLFGSGLVLIRELEAGLSIRVWDYMLYEDTTVKINPSVSRQHTFTFTYLFTPEAYDTDFNKSVKAGTGNRYNLLIWSGSSSFEWYIKGNVPVKAISITFTTAWLQASYPDVVEKLANLYVETLDCNLHFKNIDPPPELNNFVDKVFGMNLIQLRSLILNITDKLVWSAQEVQHSVSYAVEMRKVAHYLNDALEGKFPGIKEMAAKFSVGESTLRRRFEELYNTSLHDYYLEQKMKLALKMLKETRLTVSEIASRLGYEKSSTLITSFKNKFGFTPGSVKKKTG